jgi:hypothetical protein
LDQKVIEMHVAETALEYYEKTGRFEIRLKDLLNECSGNNFQLPKTSFNRTIKSLELQMAFKKITNKKHKETIIQLYPDNIRCVLTQMKVGKTYREILVQEEIWSKIIEEEMSTSKMDKAILESVSNLPDIERRFSYLQIRKAIIQLMNEIFSRHFQFYINDASSDTYRILNENVVRHLWIASKEIASQQQNQPFTMVAQYTGIPQGPHGYKIWTMQMYHILIPHFVVFVRVCLRKELNDDLEEQLNSGYYGCLEYEPLKTYWRIFEEVYLSPIINLYSIPTNS